MHSDIDVKDGGSFLHAPDHPYLIKTSLNINLAVKLTLLLSTIFYFQVSAAVFSQQVSLSVKNAPLEKVIQMLRTQSGYAFFYDAQYLKDSKPVSVKASNTTIENLLPVVFSGQPFDYEVIDKTIILRPIKTKTTPLQSIPIPVDKNIRGTVSDSIGLGLPGVNIRIKGTNTGTTTDREGKYEINLIDGSSILLFSMVGYTTKELKVDNSSIINVTLQQAISVLDETVIIAYGTTTTRLNTGSVSRVTAKEIESQPVSNPLATLAGRVPGLVITQSNGVPGSAFKVQIRGQNSIGQGNDPLFVIDGVPFAANNSSINTVTSSVGAGGLSPFNSISPSDIESIEILKDADATSIYGSRGANGVVLITTKKGKIGKTKVNLGFNTGISRVAHTVPWLNTTQYVAMRKEAFRNDGVTMNATNAYDIMVWDTTRYTNWTKELIGGTARTSNFQASLSGGSNAIQFLIGANYHRETTVFPGNMGNNRIGANFGINHQSIDKRLSVALSGNYTFSQNNLVANDITGFVTSLPNLPELFDSNGKFRWSEGGVWFQNPMAVFEQKSTNNISNLLSNLMIEYRFNGILSFKVNLGYNRISTEENMQIPDVSQNPTYNFESASHFGRSFHQSLITEPHLKLKKEIGIGTLDVVVGGSFQQNKSNGIYIMGSGYKSDALLGSVSGASSLYSSDTYNEYRYGAGFVRASYNVRNTYILNLSGRRDGSSRFGRENRIASFGAIGAAWLFSNEQFVKNNVILLSHGKVRASYGTSGNDIIGDYQYLDTYSASTYPYQGNAGLNPTRLANPHYGWEINKKFETAIELGLFKDRIFMSAAWFRNRSGNQLLSYTLPLQTGFQSLIQNLPATVQNTGIELLLSGKLVDHKGILWSSALNLTIPRNKLVAYPDLELSTYRNRFVVGKSINIRGGYLLGQNQVDPSNGFYSFVKGNGELTNLPVTPDDLTKALADLAPRFYGGLSNTIAYKGFQLDFFFEIRKQMGMSYVSDIGYSLPGRIRNQPDVVLGRWQQLGDITTIPRFSQSTSTDLYRSIGRISAADGASNYFTDASFIRFKNVMLAYNLPEKLVARLHMSECKLFLQGQNLLTFTNYYGYDPETQRYNTPPLRTWAIGINLSL